MRRPEAKRIVRTYLATIRQKQVDVLILGCTHYPLLATIIKASLPSRVAFVDSPRAMLDRIAAELPELLTESAAPTQDLFFSDVTPHVEQIASRWLRRPVQAKQATLGG